jgi:hypothetical protein
MDLSQRPDIMPEYGSLVAAQYYPERRYVFLVLDDENILETMSAHHTVLIKSAEAFKSILDSAERAFWEYMSIALSDARTNKLDTGTKDSFRTAQIEAVIKWLDTNYPQPSEQPMQVTPKSSFKSGEIHTLTAGTYELAKYDGESWSHSGQQGSVPIDCQVLLMFDILEGMAMWNVMVLPHEAKTQYPQVVIVPEERLRW